MNLLDNFVRNLTKPPKVRIVVFYSKATLLAKQVLINLINDSNCEVWAVAECANEAVRMQKCLEKQNRYGSRSCGHTASLQDVPALKKFFADLGQPQLSSILVLTDEGAPKYSSEKIERINNNLLSAMQGVVRKIDSVMITGRYCHADHVYQNQSTHERQWQSVGAEFHAVLFEDRPEKDEAAILSKSLLASGRIFFRLARQFAAIHN